MSPKNPSFVLQKVNEVSFEDRPIPQLSSPYDVRVQVKATGICGSDVHYWTHGAIGDFIVKSPMVLGHESAGIVVEVGEKVKNLKVGDRVAMEPGEPCRYCEYCKRGDYNVCNEMKFAATPPFDGTLAKYYVLPGDFCVPLPDEISLEEGSTVEPLAVAVHVCRRAQVKPHTKVVVFGAGPVGLLCAAVARAYGASVVVSVDIVEKRVEFAKSFGATHGFISPKPNPDESKIEYARRAASALKSSLDLAVDEGFDISIDASGAEVCINTALYSLRKKGRHLQAGMGSDTITFPIAHMTAQEIELGGSFRYGAGCYRDAVELIRSGKVDVGRIITHRFAFGDAERAFRAVKEQEEGLIKAVIAGPE
ncbi:putative alcohol dehydrogenase [Saitoella complicata NRRL Y-17804]|nr:putative alcohol dehydrogenase [Saitoella complicata NRRL Y-17804]ODQ55818.1 putative alcohol dehydrogenase [Saitoella complicata NRRL Y-17804]